jgi:hypothetical protein
MNECPKTPKCPLFNDNLLKRAESAEVYKRGYCKDSEKYKECMRYIVSEKVGKCADFVMPNSMLTVEQIIERMKKEGLIQ